MGGCVRCPSVKSVRERWVQKLAVWVGRNGLCVVVAVVWWMGKCDLHRLVLDARQM